MAETYDFMGDIMERYKVCKFSKKRSTIKKVLTKYLIPDDNMIEKMIMPQIIEYDYPDLHPPYKEFNINNFPTITDNMIAITACEFNLTKRIPKFGDMLIGVYSEKLPIIEIEGIRIPLLKTGITDIFSDIKKELFVLETPLMVTWTIIDIYITEGDYAFVFGFVNKKYQRQPKSIKLPYLPPNGILQQIILT